VSLQPFASSGRALVLDANILIRAVLGRQALSLIESYSERALLLTPSLAFDDAARYLPGLIARRGYPGEISTAMIEDALQNRLSRLIESMPPYVYAAREREARRRLRLRDESDWPYLALALTFGCPVWTEDRDFFGVGVPTWTTDRIHIYFDDD
jgi:predicted nucleic acid-binding protein